jgi:hypothetical protein
MKLPSIRGGSRYETVENCSIALIFLGALILSVGIGLTIISPRGLSAILAMMGALISFLATVSLILTWLTKELFGE